MMMFNKAKEHIDKVLTKLDGYFFPEDRKRRKRRQIVGASVSVLCVYLIAASCFGGSQIEINKEFDSAGSGSTYNSPGEPAVAISNSDSSSNDFTSSATEVADVNPIGKIGDTLRSGDVEYKVISTKITKSASSGYGDNKHPEAGQYVVVHIIIKNVGHEQVHISGDTIKLMDDVGAEYHMSEDLSTSGEKNHFIYEEMNPNAIKKAKLVFDTCNKDISAFEIYAYPKAFSNNDPAVIKLVK